MSDIIIKVKHKKRSAYIIGMGLGNQLMNYLFDRLSEAPVKKKGNSTYRQVKLTLTITETFKE